MVLLDKRVATFIHSKYESTMQTVSHDCAEEEEEDFYVKVPAPSFLPGLHFLRFVQSLNVCL